MLTYPHNSPQTKNCEVSQRCVSFTVKDKLVWLAFIVCFGQLSILNTILSVADEPRSSQTSASDDSELQVAPVVLSVSEGWSKWRGSKGDAQVVGLPKKWSDPERLWRFPLESNGVGGVALSQDIVMVSSRDYQDRSDLFLALDAETGVELFRHQYPSTLSLDYGNSPRSTPLILEDQIITLGAGGELAALDLESGKPLWTKHLVKELGGKMPAWGYSASPIVYENTLIVQAGGPNSALVGLNLETGEVVWRTSGRQAAYSSSILMSHNGNAQLLGCDEKSFGAWSAKDGKRLWELKLPIDRDFNVPSPVVVKNKLFIVSENNGALLYDLSDVNKESDNTRQQLKFLAQSDALSHDANSPVAVGDYVASVHEGLVLLDPSQELKTVDQWHDPSLHSYSSIIVEDKRLLITCCDGAVILLDTSEGKIKELGRMQCEESKGDLLAHSAFDQGILIIRGPLWVDAYRW
ncbi:MAG: PQQ-binding-like beta-propeller repeat protein [Pirellula sp.]